jgi:hypothetical protein
MITNFFINRRYAFTLKTCLSIKLLKWLISETISQQSISSDILTNFLLGWYVRSFLADCTLVINDRIAICKLF